MIKLYPNLLNKIKKQYSKKYDYKKMESLINNYTFINIPTIQKRLSKVKKNIQRQKSIESISLIK
jgi:hypothetical protein